jgi:tRNA(fMet)-specific endonuclease VapC
MSFLIDTDICSAHLRDVGSVTSRFSQYSGHLRISTVSLVELYAWISREKTPTRHRDGLMALLSDMTIVDLDHAVARQFGQLRGGMLDRGLVVPGMDLLIAATALVHDLVMVTHNTKHFITIPGLVVEDWLMPRPR